MNGRLSFLFFAALSLPFGAWHLLIAKDCFARRAAFDVGSGSTRMIIAEVNHCTQKIEKIISESKEKVDYREDLAIHGGVFSPAIMRNGKEVLKKFKVEAEAAGIKKDFAGVATAAFRQAKNSQAFLEEVKQELGLPIQIVSQDEEGILGFLSAMTVANRSKEDLIVWDIGAASMQLTVFQDKFQSFKGELASVSFKELALKALKKNLKESPNPLSSKQQNEIVKLAKSHAQKHVDKNLQKKIRSSSGKVYGIGSVHGISIQEQTSKESFSQKDLEAALAKQAGKTDEQVGGKYASTDVTNLALVLGYMQALGIKEVQTLKVNNANGVLINPKYW